MIKKILLLLLLCSAPMYGAEFLIDAQDKSIIVARNNGWLWGSEECLPNFIVIKVPGITSQYTEQYESNYIENDNVIYERRYKISNTYINNLITNNISKISISVDDFYNILVDRVQ